MKTLGEKIAGLRQEKNMTQQAFADVMGVTRQAISNWERNKTEPDVAALKKIGQVFGIDMNELLTDIHLERQAIDTRPLTRLFLAILATHLGSLLWLCATTSTMKEALSRYGFRFVFVLIALSIYAVFTYCIRSRDFSLLSGYDPHAPYDLDVMADMTAAMATMILTDTLSFSILSCLLEGQLSESLSMVLFVMYLAGFVLSILLVNMKYKDRIYRDPDYPDKIRSGNRILIFFAAAVMAGAMILILSGMLGWVGHNSPKAAFQVLLFLPYILLNVVWMMIEQDKLHRLIERGEVYRFGKNTLGVAVADGILLGLILLISWA